MWARDGAVLFESVSDQWASGFYNPFVLAPPNKEIYGYPEGITVAGPFHRDEHPAFRLMMRNETKPMDDAKMLRRLAKKIMIGRSSDIAEMMLLPGVSSKAQTLYSVPREYLAHLLVSQAWQDDRFLIQVCPIRDQSRPCFGSLLQQVESIPEWYLGYLIQNIRPLDLVWSRPYLEQAITELTGYGNDTQLEPNQFPWFVSRTKTDEIAMLMDRLEDQFRRSPSTYQRKRIQTIQTHLITHPEYAADAIKSNKLVSSDAQQLRSAKMLGWLAMLLDERFSDARWTTDSKCLLSSEQVTQNSSIDLADALAYYAPGTWVTQMPRRVSSWIGLVSPPRLMDRLETYLMRDRKIDLLGQLNWFGMAVAGSVLSILLPSVNRCSGITVLEASESLSQSDPVSIICSVANQIEWLECLRELNRTISAILEHGGSWRCDRVTTLHLSSDCQILDSEVIHAAQKARARAESVHSTADATERAIYCEPSFAEETATYRILRGSSEVVDGPAMERWNVGARCNQYTLLTGPTPSKRCCVTEQYQMLYSHPKLLHPLRFVPALNGLVNEIASERWPSDRVMCNGIKTFLLPSAALALTMGVVHAPKEATLFEITKVAKRGYRVYHPEITHPLSDYPGISLNQKAELPAWHEYPLPF